MASNGPPPIVHHPIPRRPFAVNPVASAEREAQKEDPRDRQAPTESLDHRPPHLGSISDLDGEAVAPGDSASISRAQSILNLTSSTLFGIFTPTITSRGSVGGGASGIFDSNTPWGVGAETPARETFGHQERDGENDGAEDNGATHSAAELAEIRKASQSLMMLQRQRRNGTAAGPSLQAAPAGRTAKDSATEATGVPQSRAVAFLSIAGRSVLLFAVGMGYGVLMARLRSETHAPLDDFTAPAPPLAESGATAAYDAIYDWRYLVSWGLSGVVLGTLLPWFDGVWDRTFGRTGSVLGKARSAQGTDWALVVRGIGAFAGVVFAMRKLPWASSMQASLTLALANPFLWYLLDRSNSGLLLAAAVGFLGSGMLMALNLDLMPNPAVHQSAHHAGLGAGMGGAFSGGAAFHQNDSSRDAALPAGAGGGNGSMGAASPVVTVETAVWMLSVLFCSCICFGNIGRRLAPRSAPSDHGQ